MVKKNDGIVKNLREGGVVMENVIGWRCGKGCGKEGVWKRMW